MKKIVALVLSLVMVLGLATTAFAVDATTTYDGLYMKKTDSATFATDDAVLANAVSYYKAVAAKDVNKDGVIAGAGEMGSVAYYTVNRMSRTAPYVEVNSLADADIVLYTDAAAKTVFMYLAKVEFGSAQYLDGVKTTDFGTACGQYTNDEDAGYDDEATYYVAEKALYVGVPTVDTATAQLMVGGKLVMVKEANLDKNAHKAVYTKDAKGDYTAIKCSVCGCVAAEAANYASIPAKAVVVDQNLAPLWYWTTATEAPAADEKVESAETFDAGIAMYVGMSVMAAAGSAVVLKKKD